MLGQRIDPGQLLVGASAVPVVPQLGLMLAAPFEDEPERTRRECAVDQLQGVDAISATCSPYFA